MDCPLGPAPLTLLFSGTEVETLASLRSLLDGNGEFVMARASPPNASVFEIVYRGVSLQLTTGAQVADFADCKKIFCNLDRAAVGSAIGISLGEHVAGGERVPAIVQALLGAAAKLGSSLGAVAAIWQPAQIVSGFGYFSESIADYLEGGAFPVLAMVNFKAAADGTVNSTGLGFLAGQELQIAENGMEQSELMRRVVRVVHDLATNGPVTEAVKLAGIEPGEAIELQPFPEAGLLKMNAYSVPKA